MRLGVLMVMVVMALGCYERVVHDGWGELRRFEDKTAAIEDEGDGAGAPGQSEETGWAVLIKRFEGSTAGHQANRLVERLRTELGLRDVWLVQRPREALVLRGRFEQRGALDAQQTLRLTRGIELDGKRPFAASELTLLSGESPNEESPLDLRKHSGMYSLQVAVYDAEIGADFRAKAEQAARALREEGDEAYFYHGPNRSLVTIGLFGEEDLVQQGTVSTYGPRVTEVQKKYPYNLVNGLTLVERWANEPERPQPSFLVRVP